MPASASPVSRAASAAAALAALAALTSAPGARGASFTIEPWGFECFGELCQPIVDAAAPIVAGETGTFVFDGAHNLWSFPDVRAKARVCAYLCVCF